MGSRSPACSRQFVNRLHDQLLPPMPQVSRRTALLSGLGAVTAGVLAGFSLDRLGMDSSIEQEPLVAPERGQWVDVASVTQVPSGAILSFKAGAVQGFLINRGGQYRALSRICTHMGSTLRFQRSKQSFVCPCHGAEFALDGRPRFRPSHFRLALPPLPEIDVRVRGNPVQIWAA
jgi:nitrite reductase/ring-hydroxylating ferredoxin subunit